MKQQPQKQEHEMNAALSRELQPGREVRLALAANDPIRVLNAIDDPALAHHHLQAMALRGRRMAKPLPEPPAQLAEDAASIEAGLAFAEEGAPGMRQEPAPILP